MRYDELNDIFSMYADVKINTPEEEALLIKKYLDTGDKKYKELIIMGVIPYIIKEVKKYHNFKKIDLVDLFQSAILGATQAFNNFDMSRGFLTYAHYHIDLGIKEYIEKNSFMVKVLTTNEKRKVFWNLSKYRDAEGKIKHSKFKKIATELDVSERDVMDVYQAITYNIGESFNSKEHGQNLSGDIDFITFQTIDEISFADDEHEDLTRSQLHKKIHEALGVLEQNERDFIIERYLRDDGHTLNETCEFLEISSSQGKVLEKKVKSKLQKILGGYARDFF